MHGAYREGVKPARASNEQGALFACGRRRRKTFNSRSRQPYIEYKQVQSTHFVQAHHVGNRFVRMKTTRTRLTTWQDDSRKGFQGPMRLDEEFLLIFFSLISESCPRFFRGHLHPEPNHQPVGDHHQCSVMCSCMKLIF